MFTRQHAATQSEGVCACGWKSLGASTARRRAGLHRHLEAARSRGEVVIDAGPADLPLASDNYDASKTDTPAGVGALNMLFRLLLSPVAQIIISLIVTAALTILVLRYARVQIPGTLFATVSFITLLVAANLFGVLVLNRGAALIRLIYGPPIASPKSALRRLLQLAMRSAQSYEYTFTPDVQTAVNRYEALDLLYAERRVAAGDGDMEALLAFVDPQTGATTKDILRTRNIEFGGTFFHFQTLGTIASQLSAIAFALLAILAMLEADHRVARVTFVQLGIGLVLLSAVVVVLILQVRLSAAQLVWIEKLEDLMSDADRDLLNRIKGKWLYPKVTAKPEFYSVLRRYLLLLHVPIALGNIVSYGFMFLCAALVTLLWPGTVNDWTGALPRAFTLLAVTAVLYIGAFWIALRVLESLRDVLQPAFVGIVTAVGTVLLMYLVTGSFDSSAALASVGAALPASIATGFASAFWKGPR